MGGNKSPEHCPLLVYFVSEIMEVVWFIQWLLIPSPLWNMLPHVGKHDTRHIVQESMKVQRKDDGMTR